MSDLRRLLGLLGRERRWIVLAALAATVTLGSGVGLVATSAYLVSRAAVVGSTAALSLSITFVRLFAVLRASARYVERYVGHLGTFRVLTRIRVWVFGSLARVGPGGLADARGGDLVSRIVGDVETLQDLYLRVLVPPLAAAATTLVASLVVGAADVRAGLVLAAFLVLGGVGLPLATGRLGRGPARALVTGRAARNAEVTEVLGGLDELLVLGEEDRIALVLADQDTRVLRAERRAARARGLTDGLAAALTAASAVVLVGLGAALVRDGAVGTVQLAGLPLVALVAFDAVTPLAALPEHLHRSRSAARRLFELADADPDVVEAPDPAPAPGGSDLRLVGVGFRYHPDGPAVLRDVDLQLPAGSRIAVVGPSGSGKSTLAALLVRLHDPTTGVIHLGGTDLRDLTLATVRTRVALVAQHDHLFDTTVRDNLLLADPDADDARLLAALDDAGLGAFVRALPQGLDERVGEGGGRLSGGERQRLLIARGLLRDAPVLVLDEATAHLDPVTERSVLAAVARRRRGLTTVTISHHPADPDDVDLVLEVDRGRCRLRPARAGGRTR